MRWTRRSVLTALAAPALLGPRALAAPSSPWRLVVVVADGGWDPTFVFDPKLHQGDIEGPQVDEDPDDPDDLNVLQTVAGIPLVTNASRRPNVTRFFETWGHRAVVLNGIWMGAIAHDPCRYRILTGTPLNSNADAATIVGVTHGADLPLGSVDVAGYSLAGSLAATAGRVGHLGQLAMLLSPETEVLPAPATLGIEAPQYVPSASDRALLEDFLAERAAELAGARPTDANYATMQEQFEARRRAARLRADAALVTDSVSVGTSPALGGALDLTLDLLANDVCRAVTLDSGSIWDTHTGNVVQHGMFDGLFDNLSALVDALDSAGLLDTTLVAVVSEMGRTPRRNSQNGKDHWGHTSAVLVGGPVRGGRSLGATDALLESLPMDLSTGEAHAGGELCKYDNFVAGLLASLDVDPARWLPGVRPFLGAL